MAKPTQALRTGMTILRGGNVPAYTLEYMTPSRKKKVGTAFRNSGLIFWYWAYPGIFGSRSCASILIVWKAKSKMKEIINKNCCLPAVREVIVRFSSVYI